MQIGITLTLCHSKNDLCYAKRSEASRQDCGDEVLHCVQDDIYIDIRNDF